GGGSGAEGAARLAMHAAEVSDPDDPAEREAESVSHAVVDAPAEETPVRVGWCYRSGSMMGHRSGCVMAIARLSGGRAGHDGVARVPAWCRRARARQGAATPPAARLRP